MLCLTCQVFFSNYFRDLGGYNVIILFWLMIIIVMSFATIELIEGVSSSLSNATVDEEWIAALALMSLIMISATYMALS